MPKTPDGGWLLDDSELDEINLLLGAASDTEPTTKADREYVRDEGGRFSETAGSGGGGGGLAGLSDEERDAIDRELDANRRRRAEEQSAAEARDVAATQRRRENEATMEQYKADKGRRHVEALFASNRLDEIPQTPEQVKLIDTMQETVAAGDMMYATTYLNDVDKSYGFDPAVREKLDELARPLAEQDAAEAARWLPRERETIGHFRETTPEQVAKAEELEAGMIGRVREQSFMIDKQGNVIASSEETGSYGWCAVFQPMMQRGEYPLPDSVGTVLTHNHPNSNSLSRGDVENSGTQNRTEVRAVGYNGNVFRASAKADKTWAEAVKEYDRVYAEVNERLSKDFRETSMGMPEYFFRLHHETWSQVAKNGFINYEYIPPATRS